MLKSTARWMPGHMRVRFLKQLTRRKVPRVAADRQMFVGFEAVNVWTHCVNLSPQRVRQ